MPNPKVAPILKVKGMDEEVEGEPSHALENLAACDNWHVHRHGRIYVFSMPLSHRKHKIYIKKFHYITNKNLLSLSHICEKKRGFFWSTCLQYPCMFVILYTNPLDMFMLNIFLTCPSFRRRGFMFVKSFFLQYPCMVLGPD